SINNPHNTYGGFSDNAKLTVGGAFAGFSGAPAAYKGQNPVTGTVSGAFAGFSGAPAAYNNKNNTFGNSLLTHVQMTNEEPCDCEGDKNYHIDPNTKTYNSPHNK